MYKVLVTTCLDVKQTVQVGLYSLQSLAGSGDVDYWHYQIQSIIVSSAGNSLNDQTV